MRIFLAAVIVVSLLSACSSSTELKDSESSPSEVKAIKKVIDAYGGWWTDKDAKVLKDIFTTEPEAVVYPIQNEVWKGENIAKKMKKAGEHVEDSKYDPRDSEVKVIGNVAWFYQKADLKYDFDGQPQDGTGIRMTGVLLKQDGKWKIAEWHSSAGVRAAPLQPVQQDQ